VESRVRSLEKSSTEAGDNTSVLLKELHDTIIGEVR
jgi:hypothetical protein